MDFRYPHSLRGVMRPHCTPMLRKRTALLRELKEMFRRYRWQPTDKSLDTKRLMLEIEMFKAKTRQIRSNAARLAKL